MQNEDAVGGPEILGSSSCTAPRIIALSDHVHVTGDYAGSDLYPFPLVLSRGVSVCIIRRTAAARWSGRDKN